MDKLEIKRFLKILTPSAMSGFGCVLLALFIIGISFVSAIYTGSLDSVQLQHIQTGDLSSNKFIAWYQLTYDKIMLDDKLGAFSLFFFWCAVGTVSYMTIAGIVKGLKDVNSIKDELEYVHVDRRKVYKEEAQRFVVRCVGLVLLFIALHVTVGRIIPVGRELARIGATEATIVGKLMYTFTATIIVAVMLHLVVVSFRLAALRVRLFGEPLSEEAED